MPGHFTHIYTARRVADWLGEQTVFNPDDVSSAGNGQHLPELLGGFGIDPQRAAQLMHTWPKFANVGAIGPDLFFFCEDYSSGPLAAFKYQDDLLMLAMAIYFWVDAAKEQGWEPLRRAPSPLCSGSGPHPSSPCPPAVKDALPGAAMGGHP